jgi:hypothetical protein
MVAPVRVSLEKLDKWFELLPRNGPGFVGPGKNNLETLEHPQDQLVFITEALGCMHGESLS